MTRSAPVWAVSIALAAVGARPARADATQVAAAEVLFQEGVKALEAGDLPVACLKLADSDRLDPANGTKLALATCEEKRGKLATSWGIYKIALGRLAPTDARLPQVKARVTALEPRLPRVVVKLAVDAPQGTKVREGETELLASTFGVPIPVDPGEHELTVDADGREQARVRYVAVESRTIDVSVSPGRPRAPAPIVVQDAPPPASAPPPEAPKPARESRTLGWVVGGVGVAALGVGAVSYVAARGKRDTADANCRDDLQRCNETGKSADDAIGTLNVVTAVGLGAGLVGVGAGAWLLLRPSPESSTAVLAGPGAVGGAVGWRVGGVF